MGEHLAYIQEVIGSSPISPTMSQGDVVQPGPRRLIVTQEIAGSNPVVPARNFLSKARAEVAQAVEHRPEKAGVPSSTLGLGTTHLNFSILSQKSVIERDNFSWAG